MLLKSRRGSANHLLYRQMALRLLAKELGGHSRPMHRSHSARLLFEMAEQGGEVAFGEEMAGV